VWARDRLSRHESPERAIIREKELHYAGKTVVVCNGQTVGPRARFDVQWGADLGLTFEYGVATQFRPDLARKVLRAHARNIHQGYSCGGAAPYGFVRRSLNIVTNELGGVIPDKEVRKGEGLRVVHLPGEDETSLQKLDIVRRIAREYHGGLGGFHTIARRLNEEGVPAPNRGRMRKGRLVSGLWTDSTIRDILEQPLFMGERAYGRKPQGTVYRFSDTSPDNTRTLSALERDSRTGTPKKLIQRDLAAWTRGKPAKKYAPIVPVDMWLENFQRIKDAARKGNSQRGVPRCHDLNKYPLVVVCGSCGQRMSGLPYMGRPSYVCSTYQRTQGTQCAHHWIPRDAIVWFAIEAIRQQIEELGKADSLREAIKAAMTEAQSMRSRADVRPLEHLRTERDRRLGEATRAMRQKVETEDTAEAAVAQAAYVEIMADYRKLVGEVKRHEEAQSLDKLDVKSEVEAAVLLLEDLHLFLDRIPRDRLREAFSSLGARAIVNFGPSEGATRTKRKTVPTSVRLELGGAESLRLSDIAASASVGHKTISGKESRDDRIRTCDLMRPRHAL
jgi:hypothetical protein